MAFIEPMHRNKPNITYLRTSLTSSSTIAMASSSGVDVVVLMYSDMVEEAM